MISLEYRMERGEDSGEASAKEIHLSSSGTCSPAARLVRGTLTFAVAGDIGESGAQQSAIASQMNQVRTQGDTSSAVLVNVDSLDVEAKFAAEASLDS